MKNLMQLKDLIKNLAKEKNINRQVLLRNYMMQRLLLEIASSNFKNNFILKGGMLVADLVGIESRSTVDMDLTIKSFSLTKANITEVFTKIFLTKTEILSYNLETLLAEKLETIISRSKTNTRMRDFYDVYILALEFKEKININLLGEALTETAKNRGTYKAIENGRGIIIEVFNSDIVLSHWNRYRKKFKYAKEIEFSNLEKEIINLWNAIEENGYRI
jgi:predicted nucleotidyltransferase component of viral defense system